MKVKVFTLSWRAEAGGFDDSAVEAFLETRTAIDVAQHFFVHEKTPVLALVVTYRDSGSQEKQRTGTRSRSADAAADLTPEERERYEALRSWRNQRARKAGQPPYLLFTNRQAADLARNSPSTKAALSETHGIGESRIQDFGSELLALVSSMRKAAATEPAGGSDDDA